MKLLYLMAPARSWPRRAAGEAGRHQGVGEGQASASVIVLDLRSSEFGITARRKTVEHAERNNNAAGTGSHPCIDTRRGHGLMLIFHCIIDDNSRTA
jgi:hypothetical protein